MLGFPILYFKGRRLMMFQLSGFYCNLHRALTNPRNAEYESSEDSKNSPKHDLKP